MKHDPREVAKEVEALLCAAKNIDIIIETEKKIPYNFLITARNGNKKTTVKKEYIPDAFDDDPNINRSYTPYFDTQCGAINTEDGYKKILLRLAWDAWKTYEYAIKHII